MKNRIIVIVALALSSQLVSADSITDTYTTGDTLTAEKMDNIKAAVNDNNSKVNAILKPIALGAIKNDGKPTLGSFGTSSVTSNVSSSLDQDSNLYIISIDGESYNDTNFITNVTAVEPARYCNTSAISNNLTIVCYNSLGTSIQSAFHFVIYKRFISGFVILPPSL